VPGHRERVPVPALPEPERPRPLPPAPRERRECSRYALAALADECRRVEGAAAGDSEKRRHAELNRAAFKLARFIRAGELTAAEVVSDLITAARRTGLEDSDGELRRYLRYGLRAGLDRAGA
jgi:hypothetical protein